MKTSNVVVGLLLVMPLLMGAMASAHVVADDYVSEHTLNVGYNSHRVVTWSLGYHAGIYGDFLVTYPASGGDQIITFFICDEENYDLWESGQSASVYHLQEHVASYAFEFRIPYSDTWYFVFKNYALFTTKTVELTLCRDLTPPTVVMNLDAGATYSGIKEITASLNEATFEVETVRLYIDGYLKDTEFDASFSYSWNTGEYSNGVHTVRIAASDNVGNEGYEEVSVYTSNAVAPPTPTSGGSGLGDNMGTVPIVLFGVAGVVVAGLAAALRSRKPRGFGDDYDVPLPGPAA